MINTRINIEGEVNPRGVIEGNVNASTVKVYPTLENIEITPSKEEHIYKSKDYYGYDEVKVKGATSDIDENIKPEHIKEGVSILGVSGNVEEINTTEIRIDPISEEQTITPEEPYNGFNKVIVGAQSGVSPEEIFNTTVTSSEVNQFLSTKLLKNAPAITIDKNVKVLSYMLNYWNYNFMPRFYCEKGQITNISYLANNSTGAYDLITFFEDIDTSKVTNITYMIANTNLGKVGEMDCSSCNRVSPICQTFQQYPNLTYFGGFKDLGKAFATGYSENYSSYTLNLSYFPNLTHESLMNIINKLYDLASAGINPQKLTLGSNLAKLTEEEIAIATNKGWNVS